LWPINLAGYTPPPEATPSQSILNFRDIDYQSPKNKTKYTKICIKEKHIPLMLVGTSLKFRSGSVLFGCGKLDISVLILFLYWMQTA
jgi:hypothetical protein